MVNLLLEMALMSISNIRKGRRTPLMYAISDKQKDIVELLLDRGADVNHETNQKMEGEKVIRLFYQITMFLLFFVSNGFCDQTVFVLFPAQMRNAPNMTGDIIEKLYIGEKLNVIETADKYWLKVETEFHNIGYASTQWVTDDIEVINKKKVELQEQQDNEQKLLREKAERLKREIEEEKKRIEKEEQERINFLKTTYPKWSKNDLNLIIQHQIRIGMDMEQCIQSWGHPDHESKTTTAAGAAIVWCYGKFCNKSLHFKDAKLEMIKE